MFREIIGNGVFKLLSFKNVRGGACSYLSVPHATPQIFWESSLKTFLLCVQLQNLTLRPWKYICWTRNCDFVIYNLFVYAKKGFHSTEGSVIENINKLHQTQGRIYGEAAGGAHPP